MLLPSALSCDSAAPARRTRTKTPSAVSALLASPPLSPTCTSSSSQYPTIANIYQSCRALQSMLSPTPPPSTSLPSPPTTNAPAPLKLRLRARKNNSAEDEGSTNTLTPRKKIAKRAAPPPRGLNKRRRAADDAHSRDAEDESCASGDDKETGSDTEMPQRPSTPKRLRLAPEILPLGLGRSDFHSLHLQQRYPTLFPSASSQTSTSDDDVLESVEAASKSVDNKEWTEDEDRMLVELVLEKLKLSKSEWQDCARSLGRDRKVVGRRWKSLMASSDIGIKTRGQRARAGLHGTWR